MSNIENLISEIRRLRACRSVTSQNREAIKAAQAVAMKEMQSRPLTVAVTRAAKAAALRRTVEAAMQAHAMEALAALEAAQARAMEAFAALNGWEADYKVIERYRFFDHSVICRANGENLALVNEPYHYVENDEERLRWMASSGFALHVPPDPMASIRDPGRTYFIVITEAESDPVNWLPEQDGRLKQRWVREVDCVESRAGCVSD
jgi:hypothetical protein